MSEDQPEEQPSSGYNEPTAPNDFVENKDAVNYEFASVWVKIEVQDEEYEAESEQHPDEALGILYEKESEHCINPNTELANNQPNQPDCQTSRDKCVHLLGQEDKPYICTKCNYKSKYSAYLDRHLVKHNDIKIKQRFPKYKCQICSYETHIKSYFISHQRKHHEKQFKCPDCDFSTAYKQNIKKHSRSHKSKESLYFCDKCPFSTKYEGYITRHLDRVHFEVSEKAKRCEDCSFSTKTGWRLNIHRRRSHKDQPIKCVHCDYETLYQCAFKEHKLTHSEKQAGSQKTKHLLKTDTSSDNQNLQNIKKERALGSLKPCDQSQIEVGAINHEEITKRNNKKKRKSNNDSHDNKQSFPTNSPQLVQDKNNLYLLDTNCELTLRNIKVKETQSQGRSFQCNSCNYSSNFKASVQRHYQRCHTDQNKPYKCVNCEFSTKTKDQITLHNKRSKSNEILNCKYCGFISVFKCQFAMHEKEHNFLKCVHCEFICDKKPEMEKHYSSIHIGMDCDFRVFRKDGHLLHEVTKTKFECQLCHQLLNNRSLLEKHMNIIHKTRMVDKIINHSKIQSLKKTITYGTVE